MSGYQQRIIRCSKVGCSGLPVEGTALCIYHREQMQRELREEKTVAICAVSGCDKVSIGSVDRHMYDTWCIEHRTKQEMEDDDLYKGKAKQNYMRVLDDKEPSLEDYKKMHEALDEATRKLEPKLSDELKEDDIYGQFKSNSYEKLGKEIGALVDEKQRLYGDSFNRSGGVLRVLYPDGVKPDQYGDLLTLVRILDKLFRIATSASGDEESPYMDIAGYGLLGARRATKAPISLPSFS